MVQSVLPTLIQGHVGAGGYPCYHRAKGWVPFLQSYLTLKPQIPLVLGKPTLDPKSLHLKVTQLTTATLNIRLSSASQSSQLLTWLKCKLHSPNHTHIHTGLYQCLSTLSNIHTHSDQGQGSVSSTRILQHMDWRLRLNRSSAW